MKFRDLYDLISAEPWARMFRTPKRIADELGSFGSVESVLEIGTAEGYVIRALVQNGSVRRAVGYDISMARLRKGIVRTRQDDLGSDVLLVLGDGVQDGVHLPFADQSIDVVLLPQVLEHVPSREGIIGLLHESSRVARAGILVALPLRDASDPLMRLGGYIDPDHIHGLFAYRNAWIYDSGKVEQLFGEAGLRYRRSTMHDEMYRLTW